MLADVNAAQMPGPARAIASRKPAGRKAFGVDPSVPATSTSLCNVQCPPVLTAPLAAAGLHVQRIQAVWKVKGLGRGVAAGVMWALGSVVRPAPCATRCSPAASRRTRRGALVCQWREDPARQPLPMAADDGEADAGTTHNAAKCSDRRPGRTFLNPGDPSRVEG
eukprot:scaffold7626_cov363-Prasinococcus_capsulatus_cf.AAC.4